MLAHTPLLFSFLGQHPQSFLDWRQLCSPFGPSLANPDRGFEDGANGDDAAQLVRRYGRQAHGCDASARTAVRIPAVLTGHDLGFQVRRQYLGGERKNTVLGTAWRRGELPNHSLR